MIHILLVDDHQAFLDGTEKWLKKRFKENSVCYPANNIVKAKQILQAYSINLAILDLELSNEPESSGFHLASYIKEKYPKTKVIAFTNYCTNRVLEKALSCGFNAFLSKCIGEGEFIKAVETMLTTNVFISSCQRSIMEKRKIHLMALFKDSVHGLSELSPKMIEVLTLLPKTTNRQELAEMLKISVNTIDTHIRNLRERLALSSKKDLALFAMEFKNEIKKSIPI